MNYPQQSTLSSRVGGISQTIWSKTGGMVIDAFRTRMCVPTWTATILWIIFIASLATAIWGIVNYARGVKALAPKCPSCPKDNQKLQGTYTILPAV